MLWMVSLQPMPRFSDFVLQRGLVWHTRLDFIHKNTRLYHAKTASRCFESETHGSTCPGQPPESRDLETKSIHVEELHHGKDPRWSWDCWVQKSSRRVWNYPQSSPHLLYAGMRSQPYHFCLPPRFLIPTQFHSSFQTLVENQNSDRQ